MGADDGWDVDDGRIGQAESDRERIERLERERDRLRAEVEKLVEDRVRFPDRPDGIGSMIEAHIGNLRAARNAAEEHARNAQWRTERAQSERDRLRGALKQIAESRDAGRHDGLAEDYPAVLDTNNAEGAVYLMWSIARAALRRDEG